MFKDNLQRTGAHGDARVGNIEIGKRRQRRRCDNAPHRKAALRAIAEEPWGAILASLAARSALISKFPDVKKKTNQAIEGTGTSEEVRVASRKS